jgi:uncharacterized tellurite resistance protein B-like protein
VEPPKICTTSNRHLPTRIFFHHQGWLQLQCPLELADTIKKSIIEMTKGAKGIDRKKLQKKVCTGVVELALQVVKSDGEVHRLEKRFIKRLAADLGVPELASGML